MPQADILSFGPTLLFLPLCFLGGYFFFATCWAPRIILTLRARHWLTRWSVLAGGLTPTEAWPELFLMFLQFGGLLFFVSSLTLVVSPTERLTPLVVVTPSVPTPTQVGTLPVENFFLLWGTHREEFLFRPAGVELTYLVERVLGGFGFFNPGKQFPSLGGRLRERFSQLSLSSPNPVHD